MPERRIGRAKPKHLPSPEEIREACLEIQKEWSEKERRRRTGTRRPFWLVRHISHRAQNAGADRNSW